MYRYAYTFDLVYSDHRMQGYLGCIFLCAQKHSIASLGSVALQDTNQNCGKHSNCCYGHMMLYLNDLNLQWWY